MNSVMDNNSILTLIKGNCIPLTNTMTLLFEVEDLSVASPATVSRAGMIYFDSSCLEWELFVTSWLERILGNNSADISFHKDLFDKVSKHARSVR